MNVYGYTAQSPINKVDPSGFLPCDGGENYASGPSAYTRADLDSQMKASAFFVEQLAWQAAGGAVLKGVGFGASRIFGSIGSRFAPTIDAFGATIASSALKATIRKIIPVYEFPFLGRRGYYLARCRVIIVGNNAPKWVWLEEFAHSLQPAVEKGVKGLARLEVEIEAKVALVKKASNLGLNKVDVAEILDSLEGCLEAYRKGLL